MASGTATVYPSGYDSVNFKYSAVNSSYPLSNPVGKGSTNTTYAQWNLTTGSGAESYVFYNFDLSSIPANAVIDSITCAAKVYINNTTSSRVATRTVQMYYGTNTAKGTASTVSTSTTALNLSCGSWTREELNDCRIKIYAKRGTSYTTTTYYNRFYGATLTVNYTWNDIKYTITTSCTGGTTTPSNPEVSSGDSQIFKIKATNDGAILSTLTLDGTNVLSQAILKQEQVEIPYSVQSVSGATYGFAESGNYWVSQNKGKSSSAAVCRVTFDLPVECTVNFYVINYAEATYDYGILGRVDQSLSTSASADSTNYWNGKDSTKNKNSEQLVSYTISSGQHWVDAKFYKDSATNSNNDTLQFRVEIIPNEEVGIIQYYEYTLTNITANHTLNATFGAAQQTKYIYIKENGAWKQYSKAYKKINGSWVEQTDLENLFNASTNYVKVEVV